MPESTESSERNVALGAALKFLKRDRSEQEVRGHLESIEVRGNTLEWVVSRLKQQGIIHDRRLAESIAHVRLGKKAVGTTKLRAELERRLLSPEIIGQIVDEFGTMQVESIDQVICAKFANPIPKDRARAARFLAGRGFEEDEIESALGRHFGSVDEFTE